MKWDLKINMLKVMLAVSVIMLSSALSFAASNEYTLSSLYEINKDGETTVRHTLKFSKNGGSKSGNQFTIPTYASDSSTISANIDGDTVLKTSYDAENENVSFTLPAGFSTKESWTIEISYRADILRSFGGSKIAQIPALGDIGVKLASQTVSIAADLDLGFAATRGPEPDNTDISVGRQLVTYQNKKGAYNKSAMLIFGDKSVAKVDVTATLKNSGFWWKDISFTLPPDTNQQQVSIDSIDPRPTAVSLDVDGNVIVNYRLRPRQKIVVTVQAVVSLSNVAYILNSTARVNDIESDLVDRYTAATDNWKSSGIEVSVDENSSVLDIVTALNTAVAEQVIKTQDQNALDISTRSQGLKYSDMLVGELRARGVPARVVLGKVFSDGNQLIENPMNHAWVEAYVPDVGWMTLDPIFASAGDYYGTTDSLHVGLVLWGVSDTRPPISLDIFKVKYVDDEFVLSETPPSVQATKYIVLPGISVFSLSAVTPAGSIVDNAAMKTLSDEAIIPLGSLAPYQTARTRLLRMGGSSFSEETIEYGLYAGESFVFVNSQQSKLSFLVVFHELGALSVMVIGYVFLRRRKRKLGRESPSKENVQLHTQDVGDQVEGADLIEGREAVHDLTHSDVLPDVVDPIIEEDVNAGNSVLPPEDVASNETPKNDTIISSGKRSGGRKRPPHNNLIQ